jgi:hypothetical protein
MNTYEKHHDEIEYVDSDDVANVEPESIIYLEDYYYILRIILVIIMAFAVFFIGRFLGQLTYSHLIFK